MKLYTTLYIMIVAALIGATIYSFVGCARVTVITGDPSLETEIDTGLITVDK